MITKITFDDLVVPYTQEFINSCPLGLPTKE